MNRQKQNEQRETFALPPLVDEIRLARQKNCDITQAINPAQIWCHSVDGRTQRERHIALVSRPVEIQTSSHLLSSAAVPIRVVIRTFNLASGQPK